MDERKDYQEDSPKNQDKLPHLKESLSRENLMELGKKGIAPFAQILHRYKDEVTPFIGALKTGCDAACRELSNTDNSSSSATKRVCGWFEEGSRLLEESNNKLNSEDSTVFLDFIKDQSAKRPVMMFSTSYLLGVFAGRMSKKQYNEKKTNSLH